MGSPLYSSPEMIQGKPYQGPECDVWSLGVILYTMLTATMPFDDSNISQFLVNVEKGNYAKPFGTSDGKFNNNYVFLQETELIPIDILMIINIE